MTSDEKRTWIMLVTTAAAYAIYAVIMPREAPTS